MTRLMKGLKRLGLLALSAVIAMGMITIVSPKLKIYAGEYAEKTSFSDMVLSEWRFADGINKTGNFTLLDSSGNIDSGKAEEKEKRLIKDESAKIVGAKYHFYLENGFVWEGNDYDVHIEMIQKRTDTHILTGGIDDWYSYKSFEDPSTKIKMFQFSGY